MLNLFQSNRMPVLAKIFCVRNDEPGDPFTPLSVIVQNRELGRWLKFSLAREYGISANVDCCFLAAFFWELYKRLPAVQAAAEESPFDSARLVWRIMALLRKEKIDDRALRNYLDQPGDSSLRHYQLSYEIAELFNQYLIYRPEWMLQWESGENNPAPAPLRWQPELWRALLADMGKYGVLHRAKLHRMLLEQLTAGEYPVQSLPPRISVFGLSAMPAMQLQTLQALAGHIEVDIYFLNPCRHYWGDIASDKEQARRSMRALLGGKTELVDDDYLEAGNPILASLGKQGREYFEMLLDMPLLQTAEQFLEHEGATALELVKNDILELTFGGEFDSGAALEPQSPPDEDSLQIHACHSPLREIEVLHDELLRLMDNRKDLSPGEVLVMAPDIAGYAPFIHSVFGDGIPFSIADRGVMEESPLINGFLALLKLPESRFTGAEVVDLLDTPAIARRYGLSAEDLRQVTLWIRDTGVRWELDGADKEKYWQVPPGGHNTWEFGLDRLLLGFAMTDENTWNGLLPSAATTEDARLIASLSHFVELLGKYRDELSEQRPPAAWRKLLSRLMADFFLPVDEEAPEFDRLQALIEEFEDATQVGGCEENLSYVLIHHWIQQQLRDVFTRNRSPYGVVQFANMSSVRGIPRRVICLLGLNDGEYPREERPHSFDLMSLRNNDYRKGDMSRRQDDRYLFLESLLSAEEVFYLSYVGRGVRDNQEKPPSMVVTEWLHYLQALFGEENIKPVAHSLQPFNPRYYQGGRLQSRQSPWYDALAKKPAQSPIFCRDPLPAAACDSLDQLERFFSHSGKYFLQQRLKVYFNADEIELKDTESFSLDALEGYHLADDALNHLIRDASLEAWQERQLAAGVVLPGNSGREQLSVRIDRAEAIHAALKETLAKGRRPPQSGVIELDGAAIQYRFDEIYGDTHLFYRVGSLRRKDLLMAWLRHLALSATAGDSVETRMIGRKDSGGKTGAEVRCFAPLDAELSRQYLGELLKLYRLGTARPLLLPPETSYAYYENYVKTEAAGKAGSAEPSFPDEKHIETEAAGKAKEAAVNKWNSSYGGAPEGDDIYWARLFSLPEALDGKERAEEFHAHAVKLWQPLCGCLGESDK